MSALLLSIIIPTRNRSGLLADLLDSLARQEKIDFEWEIVVVDNGSTDGTRAVVRDKNAALPVPVRCAPEPRPGLHHARHCGAREATGEIVSFLDDDMILSSTWVRGVEAICSGEAHAVVGRVLPKWLVEPPEWFHALSEEGVFSDLGLLDLGEERKRVEPETVFGGACFLPRKLVFDLGGFHPDGVPPERLRFRGDGETALMAKFKNAGLKSVYDPQATAQHVIGPERLTTEYLCKRAYNQGISDSFTALRAEHGVGGAPALPTQRERLAGMSPGEFISAVGRKLFRETRNSLARLAGSPLADAKRRRKQAYQDGRRFHREEVRKDTALLAYVLRPDFLNEDSE